MPTPLRQKWITDGYAFVPALLDRPTTERLRTICDRVLEQWRALDPDTGKPEPNRNAQSMRHLNRPDYFRDDPGAFVDLMEAVAAPHVLDMARQILDVEPIFYCTSLFMNPLDQSTDGNWHRDSQFTTPNEEAERFEVAKVGTQSIQLQIALVPSQDVEIVPGSFARWDTPAEYAIRRADNFIHNRSNHMPGALRIDQQAGDAAAFNPMGLHRGRYHADKLRRTLMLTYTTPDNTPDTYFSRQPWFLDEAYLRPLSAPTRAFFDRFVAVYRNTWTGAANAAAKAAY